MMTSGRQRTCSRATPRLTDRSATYYAWSITPKDDEAGSSPPESHGHVAELADAPDLESGGETRGGSSPLLPTPDMHAPKRPMRIGQIVPSSNTTMETEVPAIFAAHERVRPEDGHVTFHSSRMRMRNVTKDELA